MLFLLSQGHVWNDTRILERASSHSASFSMHHSLPLSASQAKDTEGLFLLSFYDVWLICSSPHASHHSQSTSQGLLLLSKCLHVLPRPSLPKPCRCDKRNTPRCKRPTILYFDLQPAAQGEHDGQGECCLYRPGFIQCPFPGRGKPEIDKLRAILMLNLGCAKLYP